MYLAIEGIDTAGKSTQISALAKRFPEAVFTKEPGGTPVGEKIRSLILETGVHSATTEMLLFLADRSEHVSEVIVPNRKRLIVSDRSAVSGIAYAMIKAAVGTEELLRLNRFATGGYLPDKVVILKLSEAELLRRLKAKEHDAIESRGSGYLLKIQENLEKAAELLEIPAVVIDASLPVGDITARIRDIITKGAS